MASLAPNLNGSDPTLLKLLYVQLRSAFVQSASRPANGYAVAQFLLTTEDLTKYYRSRGLPVPPEYLPVVPQPAIPAAVDADGNNVAAVPAVIGRGMPVHPSLRPTFHSLHGIQDATQARMSALKIAETEWVAINTRVEELKDMFAACLPAAYVASLTRKADWHQMTVRELVILADAHFRFLPTDVAIMDTAMESPPTADHMASTPGILDFIDSKQQTSEQYPPAVPMPYLRSLQFFRSACAGEPVMQAVLDIYDREHPEDADGEHSWEILKFVFDRHYTTIRGQHVRASAAASAATASAVIAATASAAVPAAAAVPDKACLRHLAGGKYACRRGSNCPFHHTGAAGSMPQLQSLLEDRHKARELTQAAKATSTSGSTGGGKGNGARNKKRAAGGAAASAADVDDA